MISSISIAETLHFIGNNPPSSLDCPHKLKKPIALNNSPETEEDVPAIEDIRDIINDTHNIDTNLVPSSSTKTSNKKLRIALWGDSHSAAYFFSETLIQQLEYNKKRVLPAFIPAIFNNPGVRLPLRQSCTIGQWQTEHAYVNRNPNEQWFRGLTRVSSQSHGATILMDFRSPQLNNSFHKLDIYFSTSEKISSANIRISINNDPDQDVYFSAGNKKTISVNSDYAIATLKITATNDSITLNGFAPHYDTAPDYVFDTMGIPGSTARGLQFMTTQWEQEKIEPYDIVLLEYGTNEGNNKPFNAQNYQQDLEKSLINMRKNYPNASCILIGPTDRGVRVIRKTPRSKNCKNKKSCRRPFAKEDILYYARIHSLISSIQQDSGKKFSCQAWSWQQAMGGLGGMYRWYYTNPKLASRDLIHLTPQGYKHSAKLFSGAAFLPLINTLTP